MDFYEQAKAFLGAWNAAGGATDHWWREQLWQYISPRLIARSAGEANRYRTGNSRFISATKVCRQGH
ncbi:hypothetical protein KSF_086700 [Reticulibacter mediterranei]|uniref:Uncharacterized protein n=1 Tax=Reticulibacter mediterranei TaxID=2778369 RepID=A0A8J3IXJ3_9CHLR|nr:hypothetical protein KSF_086700 [Reticulibacter mediterranei]